LGGGVSFVVAFLALIDRRSFFFLLMLLRQTRVNQSLFLFFFAGVCLQRNRE
jgi:hypothetical protein